MTPAAVISLGMLAIAAAGILVQLGRVLSVLDEVRAFQREIREEQRAQRDALETLRRDAAASARDHAHLVDHVDTVLDRVARTEQRLDTAPQGMPAHRTR